MTDFTDKEEQLLTVADLSGRLLAAVDEATTAFQAWRTGR